MLRILGIDPGTLHFGWGILELRATKINHVSHGVIHTEKGSPLAERLVAIEESLTTIVAKYKPQHAAIETLFYAKDPSAAAKLGHARGVALLVAAKQGLSIYEYAPTRIKRSIAGNGAAKKVQVASFVKLLLNLSIPLPLDASDALAAAITHSRASYGLLAKR